MPFRIMAKGITVEVDTEAELKTVLNVLSKIGPYEVEDKTSQPKIQEKVIDFYKNIGKGLMLLALQALLKAPDGLTDKELRKLLDIESNNKLAGVLTGIMRNAKKSGIYFDDMINRQKLVGQDGVIKKYKLHGSLRRILSEAKIQTDEKSAQGLL